MEIENRKKYNMILLYLQKQDIFKDYCCIEKNKSFVNYYLTNKDWLNDYKTKFNFNQPESKYENLSFDDAKNREELEALNRNGIPFKNMQTDLNQYSKKNYLLKKDLYSISIPQDIELISEDYYNECFGEVDFGFDKVKAYIIKDTMLMVMEGNDKVIFICDLEGNEEGFNFEYDTKIKGIIILEEIDLENIINQISATGISKYLEYNNINTENENIQVITSNNGNTIAKYLKYSEDNNSNINDINDNNINNAIEEENNDNKNKEEITETKEENNNKSNNPFYSGDNNEKEDNDDQENSSEEDNEEEEEEENDEKKNLNEFVDYYWNSVPEFWLEEALEEIKNPKRNNDKPENQVNTQNVDDINKNKNNNNDGFVQMDINFSQHFNNSMNGDGVKLRGRPNPKRSIGSRFNPNNNYYHNMNINMNTNTNNNINMNNNMNMNPDMNTMSNYMNNTNYNNNMNNANNANNVNNVNNMNNMNNMNNVNDNMNNLIFQGMRNNPGSSNNFNFYNNNMLNQTNNNNNNFNYSPNNPPFQFNNQYNNGNMNQIPKGYNTPYNINNNGMFNGNNPNFNNFNNFGNQTNIMSSSATMNINRNNMFPNQNNFNNNINLMLNRNVISEQIMYNNPIQNSMGNIQNNSYIQGFNNGPFTHIGMNQSNQYMLQNNNNNS